MLSRKIKDKVELITHSRRIHVATALETGNPLSAIDIIREVTNFRQNLGTSELR
jgi:hypothetical protein